MISWSKKRKFLYASGVIIVILGAIAIPAFLILYTPPTCFDGKQNGNEQGVDCGGSCSRLCQNNFKSPQVAWTRFEEISPNLYNIAAYIINQNNEGEAIDVPYHFVLYGTDGISIGDTKGVVTLPPHRNTLAFKTAVSTSKRNLSKAFFEFTSEPDWHKKIDPLQALAVADKEYTEDEISSSLAVTLKNTSVYPIKNISVYAILYDTEGNSLGFSRTVIEEVPPQQTEVASFTWPKNHGGKVISEDVLVVQE